MIKSYQFLNAAYRFFDGDDLKDVFYLPDTTTSAASSGATGVTLTESVNSNSRFLSKVELSDIGFESIELFIAQFDSDKATLSSLPAALADTPNLVFVTEAADFPDAVSGVITLVSGVAYVISGAVTITNRIDLNNAAIVGTSFETDSLVYANTSLSMFSGSKGGHIEGLTLSAAVGATIFDITGTSLEKLFIRFVRFTGSDIGTLSTFDVVQFFFCAFLGNSGGLIIDDVAVLSYNAVIWFDSNTATTFLSLTGDFEDTQIISSTFEVSTPRTALDISGMTSIARGNIAGGSVFAGTGTYVTGSFGSEWEVEARGIPTEKDETAVGECHITTSAATTISVVNTPVKVAGTTTLDENFRFDDDTGTDNRLRYIGTKTRKFNVSANISALSASNNIVFSWYIAKNGVTNSNHRTQNKQGTSADIGAVTVSGIVELATNDYIEVYVENNDDTTNVTAEYMTLTAI